jgi:polyisoprenoid-binding protein YceI
MKHISADYPPGGMPSRDPAPRTVTGVLTLHGVTKQVTLCVAAHSVEVN